MNAIKPILLILGSSKVFANPEVVCPDDCIAKWCQCANACFGDCIPDDPDCGGIPPMMLSGTSNDCIDNCNNNWCYCTLELCGDPTIQHFGCDPAIPGVDPPGQGFCGTIPPTASNVPSSVPTVSSAPSTSSAPSRDCTCCDCTHGSGANPDPHYTIWSSQWYDFQGGCDSIAIDNPILQLQLQTRPRGSYSTITQVGLLMKATGEYLRLHIDGRVEQNLSSASRVTYTQPTSSSYRVDFNDPNGESYIQIYSWYSGMSVNVLGKGTVFSDSEGMFGSWNFGGVRFRNGTNFDLSGGYLDVKSRSPELALDWQVSLAESKLFEPSELCDGSSACGPGEVFGCEGTGGGEEPARMLREKTERFLQSGAVCSKTCDDLPEGSPRDQCKLDSELTGLSESTWACEPNYLNPILADSVPCEFVKEDEGRCSKKGDACQRLGGFCKEDCESSDTHVCLPGICTFNSWGSWMHDGHDRKLGMIEKWEKDDRPGFGNFESSEPHWSNGGPWDDIFPSCECYVPVMCSSAA